MPKPERRLNLSGPLTVAVCETLQAEFATALAQADTVVVRIDPEAEIDLTFLQLLIAADRTAKARGKRVELQTPPSGAFAEALRSCGYPFAPGVTSLGQIFAPYGGRA